ncbi:DinB family protein [Ornithinimicrobium sp. Y1847]|uniref:DinB family protein n=1 Tax=Ornithinimicrobium sp. Y1847 TaxID=3405419 RepID=UPI003B67838E
MSDQGDRRVLLQNQLDIMWRFAEQFVLDDVTDELALWEPSMNVCTVRQADGRWMADWPDEDNPPLPDVTIGWLLWHIEWWWTDTISRVEGDGPISPEEHVWSGGTAGVAAAKRRWDQVLAAPDLDLDRAVSWLLPEPQPLWRVAAWVNVEFTKNLAEINQLIGRHANSTPV